MRQLAILVGLTLMAGAPLSLQASQKVTFSVKYGTVNLGSWDHYAAGKSKAGQYDGASFDSSNGPGFATVTLARPANSVDEKNLFASLKPAHMRLVVQARKGSVVVSTVTCEKAMPSDFGVNGDPSKVPEVLVFACTKIVTVPVKSGPKPKP